MALGLTAVAAQTWFSIINREIARAKAECIAAPNLVPYYDGMTLCPGQSTILRLEIPGAFEPGGSEFNYNGLGRHHPVIPAWPLGRLRPFVEIFESARAPLHGGGQAKCEMKPLGAHRRAARVSLSLIVTANNRSLSSARAEVATL
jgi:hypothetical protein